MAILNPVQIKVSGTEYPAALAAASAGGDKVRTSSGTFVAVKNAGVGPHTVTIVSPGTVGGLAIDDAAVVVAPATTLLIGPFAPVFKDEAGQVSLTYDSAVDLTIGAFSI